MATLPIELVDIILRIVALEEDPLSPVHPHYVLSAAALTHPTWRAQATRLLLQHPTFLNFRNVTAFGTALANYPPRSGPQVESLTLKPRGGTAEFEEALRELLQSKRWGGLRTVAFFYAGASQRRNLQLGMLSSTVGATLTTLVLAHLELELPDSALRIRPFPHLTTLDLRHISFPIRPSPHADVLPLFFSLLAPSLRTLHLQSGRSKGVVTINDFRALAPKLSHLSLADFDSSRSASPAFTGWGSKLDLSPFSSVRNFEFWWPKDARGELPLAALSRENVVRTLSIRDAVLERGEVEDADVWSNAGSDEADDSEDDGDDDEEREVGSDDRFGVVVARLHRALLHSGEAPPLLPCLKRVIFSRTSGQCAGRDEGNARAFRDLVAGLAKLEVEVFFEERYWESESAARPFASDSG